MSNEFAGHVVRRLFPDSRLNEKVGEITVSFAFCPAMRQTRHIPCDRMPIRDGCAGAITSDGF